MALSANRLAFIQKHKSEVISACSGTGIFPSVKMAQMIIESSDNKGNSGGGITALKANNYFGIKANKGYTGQKMAFNTPKDGQPVNFFRVYQNAKDSIIDHTNFLKANSRYTKHGVFSAKTPQAQAQALENAGYAEGANYAAKLMQLIKNYNLTALDTEMLLNQKKK